jgi:hypothetical protein
MEAGVNSPNRGNHVNADQQNRTATEPHGKAIIAASYVPIIFHIFFGIDNTLSLFMQFTSSNASAQLGEGRYVCSV